jgi:hypothetical protein
VRANHCCYRQTFSCCSRGTGCAVHAACCGLLVGNSQQVKAARVAAQQLEASGGHVRATVGPARGGLSAAGCQLPHGLSDPAAAAVGQRQVSAVGHLLAICSVCADCLFSESAGVCASCCLLNAAVVLCGNAPLSGAVAVLSRAVPSPVELLLCH